MSKRKREAIEKAAADKEFTAAVNNKSLDLDTGWKSRWTNLSLQRKSLSILIIGLLSLSALGAGWKYLDENAKQTMSQRASATPLNPSQEGLLSKINPLVPAGLPSPTPQLSKEYIYAGSRLLAVEDANATAAPPADLAIWRPSTGVWWVMGGPGSQQFNQQWGLNGDKPVPADYDGDGKTDFAIFRPDTNAHTGTWYIVYSSSGSWTSNQFGSDTDYATPGDFDGDGKTDIAVWRASNGVWYILRSSDIGVSYIYFGGSGDQPAAADFDGDGKADAAVWRNSDKTFYSQNSSNQANQSIVFSVNSTEPVPADYDGDGKADYAIRAGADWVIRNSTNSQMQTISWQQLTDTAVANDYDGDGKVDIAVWRSSNGNWYIRKSGSGGALRQEQWGMAGDIPVPAFYRR